MKKQGTSWSLSFTNKKKTCQCSLFLLLSLLCTIMTIFYNNNNNYYCCDNDDKTTSGKVLFVHAFTVATTTNNKKRSRNVIISSSSTTTTSLYVSELHIPGYIETKKPFILSPEEYEKNKYKLNIRTYKANIDYESLLPYNDGYLIHKTIQPILTNDECNHIIDEAEYIALNKIQWTTNRHGNYPTTDLPLIELPNTIEFLRLILYERIYPILRQQFHMYIPNPDALRVADGFIVKYDANNGQKELKPHRDGSVISFNIALNDINEYTDGGTWFHSLNETSIQIPKGNMISHASGLLHGGNGITSGIRYILVAFVIVEGYDSWSMRFYNQIRNL